MPTMGEVHIVAALSNLSIRYALQGGIADIISPRVKVAKQSDKYYIYDKSNLRVENTKLKDRSSANEYNWTLSSASYFCEGHALKHLITDKERKNADVVIDPEADTTEALTEKMMVRREYDVASQLLSTTNITQYTTKSGTGQWSDWTNGVSDPIADLTTAITTIRGTTGYIPNAAVMDFNTALNLAGHPDMVDLVKGHTSVEKATVLNVLRDLIGLEPLICSMAYNSAAEGASDSLSAVWGKDVLIAYCPDPIIAAVRSGRTSASVNLGTKTVALAVTFDWGGRVTKRWISNDPEGTYIKVEEQGINSKIISEYFGYLIKAAIA